MITRLKTAWAKLVLWLMLHWYSMDTIQRGLARMAQEVRQVGNTTTYTLDGGLVIKITRRCYTLDVIEEGE